MMYKNFKITITKIKFYEIIKKSLTPTPKTIIKIYPLKLKENLFLIEKYKNFLIEIRNQLSWAIKAIPR